MNKKVTAVCVVSVFLWWKGYAQQKLSYKVISPPSEYLGTFSSSEGIDWQITVQNLEMPRPGIQHSRVRYEQAKQHQLRRYANRMMAQENRMSSTISLPIVEFDTAGNGYNGSVPNDNDVAVSEDNRILSVKNTNVYGFNLNTQSVEYNKSLNALFFPLQQSGVKYDPRVIYDPDYDRFIVVCLKDYTYQKSKILIAFSTTTNPNDPWHLYALPGNPLNNDTWSDYPVVGINKYELFIGINTFYNGSQNNSGFHESCLWQIDKIAGYNGDSVLQTNYYYDIFTERNDSIFNITPIPGGMSPYGPNMYFLSNENLSLENDTFYLLEITNRLSDAPELTYRVIKSENKYFFPIDANQPGNHLLQTNDSRVLGGFYHRDRIFFVQNTTDTSKGRAAIYFGQIYDVASPAPVAKGKFISSDTLHFGFPNIAYTGINECDNQAIISFCYSDSVVNPGFGCVYVDNALNVSEMVVIREGDNYMDALSGNLERWGDYSGAQRMYHSPGRVIVAGCYGLSTKAYGTWLAQVASPEISSASSPYIAQVTIPSAFGKCDASVNIEMQSGVPPYVITLNETQTTTHEADFSSLCPGVYILQIEDSLYCRLYDTIRIDYHPPANAIFPNPAGEKVMLYFELPETGSFEVNIYDMSGRQVLHLFEGTAKKGKNLFSFNSGALAEGQYVVRIEYNGQTIAKEKLLVVR